MNMLSYLLPWKNTYIPDGYQPMSLEEQNQEKEAIDFFTEILDRLKHTQAQWTQEERDQAHKMQSRLGSGYVIGDKDYPYSVSYIFKQMKLSELPIEVFPNEVLERVFKFVKNCDIKNLRRVNRKWHDILQNVYGTEGLKMLLNSKLDPIILEEQWKKDKEKLTSRGDKILPRQAYNIAYLSARELFFKQMLMLDSQIDISELEGALDFIYVKDTLEDIVNLATLAKLPTEIEPTQKRLEIAIKIKNTTLARNILVKADPERQKEWRQECLSTLLRNCTTSESCRRLFEEWTQELPDNSAAFLMLDEIDDTKNLDFLRWTTKCFPRENLFTEEDFGLLILLFLCSCYVSCFEKENNNILENLFIDILKGFSDVQRKKFLAFLEKLALDSEKDQETAANVSIMQAQELVYDIFKVPSGKRFNVSEKSGFIPNKEQKIIQNKLYCALRRGDIHRIKQIITHPQFTLDSEYIDKILKEFLGEGLSRSRKGKIAMDKSISYLFQLLPTLKETINIKNVKILALLELSESLKCLTRSRNKELQRFFSSSKETKQFINELIEKDKFLSMQWMMLVLGVPIDLVTSLLKERFNSHRFDLKTLRLLKDSNCISLLDRFDWKSACKRTIINRIPSYLIQLEVLKFLLNEKLVNPQDILKDPDYGEYRLIVLEYCAFHDEKLARAACEKYINTIFKSTQPPENAYGITYFNEYPTLNRIINFQDFIRFIPSIQEALKEELSDEMKEWLQTCNACKELVEIYVGNEKCSVSYAKARAFVESTEDMFMWRDILKQCIASGEGSPLYELYLGEKRFLAAQIASESNSERKEYLQEMQNLAQALENKQNASYQSNHTMAYRPR